MKKPFSTLLIASLGAAALAAPALAQPYGQPGYGPPPAYGPPHGYGRGEDGGSEIGRRMHWIEQRILHGRNDGSLDRREFDRVQRSLDSIRHEEQGFRANHGGRLDPSVLADLEARLDQLNDQIRWMRAHDDRRPW